jgi:CRISPR-associated protein Cas5d
MQPIIVETWGDFACFTRPETKVERLSYPVMTPSAARGVLDAIYAKPEEFSWRISRIEVLRPIRFIALRRNEVKEKINVNAVSKAMRGGETPVIICDATEEITGTDMAGRTQRQTMALRDVRYRIYARIQPRPAFAGKLAALEAQAERRIKSGKCFYQPFFGLREFVAYFSPPTEGGFLPVDETQDLGLMLYDVFNLDECVIGFAKPFITAFEAHLERGVMEVPDWDSSRVLKPPAVGSSPC